MHSWLALILLCVSTVKSDCNIAQTYYIRTALNGLTIDSSASQIVIQSFNGFEVQQWRFECGSQPGLYYIVNLATGNVLDTERYHDPVGGQHIYVKPRDGTLYQQWSLDAEGRIVNAETGLNLDVRESNFYPGNILWLYEDNGTMAQQFILQEKM